LSGPSGGNEPKISQGGAVALSIGTVELLQVFIGLLNLEGRIFDFVAALDFGISGDFVAALDFGISGDYATSIHVGAWSLAPAFPRTALSTSASTRRALSWAFSSR
jgi:hypothetical protein